MAFGGKLKSGVMEQGGARFPGWTNNLSIVNATTSEAADSIKITGSNGTALSTINIGAITLPSATTGRLTTFQVTADVTIDLTGAHWGFGTLGNLTDQILYVYALNNNGSLVWGVAAKPGRLIVANADDSATATDINTYHEVLVSSALSADAQARVVGWFYAAFTDTGGASEDLWAVQTGDGDINTNAESVESVPLIKGYMRNIGLAGTTTAETNDSILITGADGQVLSTTNPGWVVLPSTTAGRLQAFQVTANVTIDLTGANWGEGGDGDLTDYLLSVYAINDAGLLKWGVGSIPNHETILNADDSATATDINQINEVLVNTALTSDAGCLEIGWFKAAFDDADGASGDLWVVQTSSSNDINIGPRPQLAQLWTPTGSWSTNTTHQGALRRLGGFAEIAYRLTTTGNPDTAALTFDMPVGLVIDTAKSVDATGDMLSAGSANENGVEKYLTKVTRDSTTVFSMRGWETDGGAGDDVEEASAYTQAYPFTWDANDSASFVVIVPIVGWS